MSVLCILIVPFQVKNGLVTKPFLTWKGTINIHNTDRMTKPFLTGKGTINIYNTDIE
jgi:hypothetical protein